MFPRPIAQSGLWMQRTYKIFLPIALFLWLLPLIGIAITSVRPGSDLASGNYFGMPSGFAGVENYTAVFKNSNIGQYIWNSFRVTIPTVIGAVGLSCLTGYALATYKFRGNLFIFFLLFIFLCAVLLFCLQVLNARILFPETFAIRKKIKNSTKKIYF